MDTSYAAWRLRTPAPYSIRAVTKARVGQAARCRNGSHSSNATPTSRSDFEYEVMHLMSEVMAHTITLHLLDAPGRRAPLRAQAPGARRAAAEEGARLLPQPLGRDALAPEARAARSRSPVPASGSLGKRQQPAAPSCAARRPRPRTRPAASPTIARRSAFCAPFVHDDAAQRHRVPSATSTTIVDRRWCAASARSAARARACEREVLERAARDSGGLLERGRCARAPRPGRRRWRSGCARC